MWRAKYPTPEICNVAASVSPIGARYVMTTSSPGTSRLDPTAVVVVLDGRDGPFTQGSSNLDSGVAKYNSAPAGTERVEVRSPHSAFRPHGQSTSWPSLTAAVGRSKIGLGRQHDADHVPALLLRAVLHLGGCSDKFEVFTTSSGWDHAPSTPPDPTPSPPRILRFAKFLQFPVQSWPPRYPHLRFSSCIFTNP